MNIVKTVAPISIEDLKQYFKDKSTVYIIDYKNSTIKGTKLFTYLSNLDIPCDIDFTGCLEDECFSAIKDYMHSTMLVNISSLEHAVINILMQFKGISAKHDTKFLDENTEIIKHWLTRIDSLPLFNMSIIGDNNFKDYIDQFEVDETDSLVGVNFLSLIKNPEMYDLYNVIDNSAIRNYTKYFNEYMFKGKNLYSYWANENNPMFILTYSIASGNITADEYTKIKQQAIEELENAASIR